MIGEELDTLGEETDTQRPPDSRMNRFSEPFCRLSLGSLLLSTLLVTRTAKTVPHCLLVSLSARACCNNCIYQDSFDYSPVETAHPAQAGSLHVVTGPSDPAHYRNSASTASVLDPNDPETPSSWPASSILAAIRCVHPRTSKFFLCVVRGRAAPEQCAAACASTPIRASLPTNVFKITA